MTPRTVVMTRQPEQSGAVENGLAAAGYRVAFLPLTDFELPADLGPLRAAVACLAPDPAPNPTHDAGPPAGASSPLVGGPAGADAPVWLVLTSPNTVRALALCGWDGRVAPGTRIAVTGPGTARVLAEEAGCPEVPWMPVDDASAAGIVAQFPAPVPTPAPGPGAAGRGTAGRRVLLPQSSLATSEVADGIVRRGWDVERVEAYRTVPYPAASGRRLLSPDRVPQSAAAMASGPAPALVTLQDLVGADVVLTSPSAVAELVRRRGSGVPAGTRFIAIGRPTQAAAEGLGLDLAGTATSPDTAGLLAVLTGS
ncbi:uroporphyrinogen-III synthase [Citricoccus sp. NPDC055426]|uniref:uroporphyrinogen-III synthase n=1 Tax=Citricoccus sp. NPDC055426 TaxID=3155536 RepID=UPI00343E97FE